MLTFILVLLSNITYFLFSFLVLKQNKVLLISQRRKQTYIKDRKFHYSIAKNR